MLKCYLLKEVFTDCVIWKNTPYPCHSLALILLHLLNNSYHCLTLCWIVIYYISSRETGTISATKPNAQGKGRGWRLNQSAMTNDLINCANCLLWWSLHKNSKEWDSESFQVGEHAEVLNASREYESSVFLPPYLACPVYLFNWAVLGVNVGNVQTCREFLLEFIWDKTNNICHYTKLYYTHIGISLSFKVFM